MFNHVTPRVNSKANWRKVSPFALFLLCQSSYCVHDHPSVSDLYNISICQKERCWRKQHNFFSDSEDKRRARHLEKSLPHSPRLGGAWCSSWASSWGPASQQPCQSPVINCRSPHKYTNSSTTPNHHSVSCNWSPGSVLDRCWLRFVLALFMSSFICCMLCSVDGLILLPFPLPLAAATLLHHCVGTAYEIIVNQALVL